MTFNMRTRQNQAVLFFGAGQLQRSIIERAKALGLFTVAIDPDKNAYAKSIPDVFEVVNGDDYHETLRIARKHKVSSVLTAATDKPLVMMARVAAILHLPFYSVATAQKSVDKLLQKECFIRCGVPCAQGILLTRNVLQHAESLDLAFPLVIKPRDNSGSRGVIFCRDRTNLVECLAEAFKHTKLDTVLAEEYIDGKEYSIESLHYGGCSKIIQFTEKITTPLPYNVELGHIQPAELSKIQIEQIAVIINRIAAAFQFDQCASHTELKINSHGIWIIETSPRLGGDQITSTLTPLSTGINMEEALISISLGLSPNVNAAHSNKCSMIRYFNLPPGLTIRNVDDITNLRNRDGVTSLTFTLMKGSNTPIIKSSLDRYGDIVLAAQSREALSVKYDSFLLALRNVL